MKFAARQRLQYAAHTPAFILRMGAAADATRPCLADKHAPEVPEGGVQESDGALAELGTDEAPVVVITQKKHLTLAEVEAEVEAERSMSGERGVEQKGVSGAAGPSPALQDGRSSSAAVQLGG